MNEEYEFIMNKLEHLDDEKLCFNNPTEKEYFKLGYLYCLREIQEFLQNKEVK